LPHHCPTSKILVKNARVLSGDDDGNVVFLVLVVVSVAALVVTSHRSSYLSFLNKYKDDVSGFGEDVVRGREQDI